MHLPLNPISEAYFTNAIPFISLLSASVLMDRIRGIKLDRKKLAAVVLVAIIVVYPLTTLGMLSFFIKKDLDRDLDDEWRMHYKVQEVTKFIKETTEKDDLLISWDPIYVVETGRNLDINYSYGFFSWNDLKGYPTPLVEKYHLVNDEKVKDDVESGRARMYITTPSAPPYIEEHLLENGYILAKRIGNVEVYTLT